MRSPREARRQGQCSASARVSADEIRGHDDNDLSGGGWLGDVDSGGEEEDDEEEEEEEAEFRPPEALRELIALIQERAALRKKGRWEEADVIRAELNEAGVSVQDRSGTWKAVGLGGELWVGEVGGAHRRFSEKKKKLKKKNTKEAARNRHVVFVEFLLRTFGREALSEGGGVLDVAGGKGLVAAELKAHGIPCTVVEPRAAAPVRAEGEGGTTVLRDVEVPRFEGRFDLHREGGGSSGLEEMCSSASALIGMHPDEVTDAIADTALRLGKPWAVVPCCVFSKDFPERRIWAGGGESLPVKDYEDLLVWLRQKHEGVMEANLNFLGRHRVVFHMGDDGKEPPAAAREESDRLGYVREKCRKQPKFREESPPQAPAPATHE